MQKFLDGRKHGRLTRNVNHLCNPNCYAEKWTVRGCLQLGVITKFSIKKGEELALDYQWDMSKSIKPTKCQCGSHYCWGCLENNSVMLAEWILSHENNSRKM